MENMTEKQVSRLFDASIAPMIIRQYGPKDKPAIRQAFHEWKDELHRAGLISDKQVQDYCYVGKYK